MSGIYAYAGDDGFPFYVPDKTEEWGSDEWGENNYLPFGLDRATVFRWLYRIRTWNVTCLIPGGSKTESIAVYAAHEAEIIVRPGVFQGFAEFHIPYPDEGEIGIAYNIMQMDLFEGDSRGAVIKVGDLYHVQYDFNENGGEVQPSWGDTITRLSEDSWQAANSFGTRTWRWEPGSWWPYDPGDGGGPCFDADTGAQIRSDTWSIEAP